MSNRDAVPAKQKFPQWQRDVNDRLSALERRKTQGAITLDTLQTNGNVEVAGALTVDGALTYQAKPGLVATIEGDRPWTQSLERLGSPNVQGGTARNTVALVTRDAGDGTVIDISPPPHIQVVQGAATSCATGVRVPIPAAGYTLSYSAPFSFDETWDATNAAILLPVNGFYEFFVYGTWAAVNDNTVRNVTPQISTNGGASWTDHFSDTKTTNVVAGDVATHTFVFGNQAYNAGSLLRLSVFHRSATTPINFQVIRFTAKFLRGNV